MFERVAARHHLPLMPDLIAGVLFQQDLMLDDGVHPNAAGQQVMAEEHGRCAVKIFLIPTVNTLSPPSPPGLKRSGRVL